MRERRFFLAGRLSRLGMRLLIVDGATPVGTPLVWVAPRRQYVH